MAFFKKLKERMFKSSSKIDEGLEAIVSDGGAEEAVERADQIAARAQAEAEARQRPRALKQKLQSPKTRKSATSQRKQHAKPPKSVWPQRSCTKPKKQSGLRVRIQNAKPRRSVLRKSALPPWRRLKNHKKPCARP